jgi:hypothetical protein
MRTSIQLGLGAYKRSFAGQPEIQLVNRYVEKDPSNDQEHTILLSRSGSNLLNGAMTGGINRGNYSKAGLFNGDLFCVQGHNLWRYGQTGIPQQITGTIANDGNPYVAWAKGIGYEFLFISDGSTLQYFSEHATAVLTLTGNVLATEVIVINGVYYGWSLTVDAGTPNGTVGAPYMAHLATGGIDTAANNTQSLANMALLINFAGISGGDYSSAVPGPNTICAAVSNENTIIFTAYDNTAAGNAYTSTVSNSGGGSIAFGAGTFQGGGGTTLRPVTGMGSGEVVKALASVSSYVLVSVGNSQKFYWINPGEIIIDPLNFASKESNPDNILDMLTVGDQVLICGNGSAENWYATGVFAAPFAPVEGRVYARGVVEGTPVVVNDGVILVGNDGIVYQIGYKYGGQAQWGVHRISDHALEEQIRITLRSEQGQPP